MISCKLIQVSRNPQGLAVRAESSVTAEAIQVGRSARCEIHLPDHRVNLIHAVIKRSADGTLYIEAEKDAIGINGFFEQSAALSLGTRVEIGPYRVVVEPAQDACDITLSVEFMHPLSEQGTMKASGAASVTLADLGLNKRTLAYRLAAGILFLFVLLPLLPGASTAFDRWQSNLPVTLTDSWSPGPLPGGHSAFGERCSVCHQRAFGSVSDDACMACHKQIARHLDAKLWPDADLQAKTFKRVRCTDCHQDHKGRAKLVMFDSSRCVACHGQMKDAGLGEVRDFGTEHPPFYLTFWDGSKVVRIRQDKERELAERPALKLDHQLHLDKKGVSSPLGVTVLTCSDCHRLEDSGTHFAPMTMKGTCQQSECHVQYFPEPVMEVAPHGSERNIVNRLRELYAKWLVDSPVESKAACGSSSGSVNAAMRTLVCADALARKDAATFFRENHECGECHEIESSGNKDVPWKIAPLHITRNYQPGAVFPHSSHNTIDCTECHNKVNSKVSEEISMPGIEKCRECHTGSRPVNGKVASACDSCHRYHRGTK